MVLPSPNWISGLGLTDASVPWSDTEVVFFPCVVNAVSHVRVRGLPRWFKNNNLHF